MNNKRLNIKKFVKVSAVALAIISVGGVASTINANTNVHADGIANIDLAPRNSEVYKQMAQDEQFGEKDDKREVHEGQEYMKQHHIKPTDQGFVLPANGSKPAVSNSKVTKHLHNHIASTRLSKATIRKIMNQINIDKHAIRNDKKHLSTRSAKRFMNNYTKKFRSVKRAKREQKRAMATKGAKRYLYYYKDEVKHEKDLVRLIKSTRVSKVTKHHTRRSLKKVRKNIRKNRKHTRRLHKSVSHSRRSHKHLIK